MSKIKYLGIAIVVVSAVCLWLFTKEIECRFPAVNKLVVSNVQYGPFVEWIPVAGVFSPDAIPEIHHVRAQIDEMYLRRMVVGLKATTQLEDSVYALELAHIYPHVVDGRINVDLNFVDGIPDKREGAVRLRLQLSKPTDVLLLPIGGFYFDTDGKWVFVVEDNIGVRRDIRLGRKNSDYFEVIEGLSPGEQVITSSYEQFKDRRSVDLSMVTDAHE